MRSASQSHDAVEHRYERAVTGGVERAHDRRRVHQDRRHRRTGRERLVQVEHVEVLVGRARMVRSVAGRVGRDRRDRAVGGGRDAVAERRHERSPAAGRRRARAPAPRDPSPAAPAPGPAPALCTPPGIGHAVRAHEPDAHRATVPVTPAEERDARSDEDGDVHRRRRNRGHSVPDMPALRTVASPRASAAILELAAEAERRGFAGIACPSLGTALGLAASLAHVTDDPVLHVDPADLPLPRGRGRGHGVTSTR